MNPEMQMEYISLVGKEDCLEYNGIDNPGMPTSPKFFTPYNFVDFNILCFFVVLNSTVYISWYFKVLFYNILEP